MQEVYNIDMYTRLYDYLKKKKNNTSKLKNSNMVLEKIFLIKHKELTYTLQLNLQFF